MMAFASYNTGFRSGTYVLNNWTNPPARPEEITAYEAGVKSEWLDRKLRLNSSVFYYQYDDIQLRRTALSGGTFVTFNAAQSEIYGLDLDFDYVASSELTIVGGLELLHAEYTSFPSGPCTTPAVIGGTTLGGAVTAVCDLSGNDMIRAPSVTANLGVRYSTPLWGGTFNVFANDGYNSGFAWDPDNRLQQKSLSHGQCHGRLVAERALAVRTVVAESARCRGQRRGAGGPGRNRRLLARRAAHFRCPGGHLLVTDPH